MTSGVALAALAGSLMWLATAAGAALVFLRPRGHDRSGSALLTAGAGIMLAASLFSLLIPAWRLAGARTALGGLVAGALLMVGVEAALRLLRRREKPQHATLVVLAMTIHNVPEGLAAGVAMGALAHSTEWAPGVILAIGLAIQDFPEGLAVAWPMRAGGHSAARSFFVGQASGFVELLAAVGAAYAVSMTTLALPWLLALAAGAMIAVVLRHMQPPPLERLGGYAWMGAGFGLMATLDVVLGRLMP